MDQFCEMARAHEQGEIPPPIMWGVCPTLFDPSQAPPGRHTAFMWAKLPYVLHRDASNWDADQEAHGPSDAGLLDAFRPQSGRRRNCAGFVQPLAPGLRTQPAEHVPQRPARRVIVVRTGRLPQAVSRRRSVSDPCRRPLPLWWVNASGGQHHGLVRLKCRRSAGLRPGPGHVVESSPGGARLASSVKPNRPEQARRAIRTSAGWARSVGQSDVLDHVRRTLIIVQPGRRPGVRPLRMRSTFTNEPLLGRRACRARRSSHDHRPCGPGHRSGRSFGIRGR
jgi:hypothetical protein